MKITATSKIDFKTVRAFAYMNAFRTNKPLKKVLIYCFTCLLLAAILWLEMHLMGVSWVSVALMAVAVLLLVLELYLYLVYPRMCYKGMGETKGCAYSFTFLDDKILLQAKENGLAGDITLEYKCLRKAVETKDYLYLFQGKGQALMVDKKTIKGGTAEQLRGTLVGYLNGHYKIYKK